MIDSERLRLQFNSRLVSGYRIVLATIFKRRFWQSIQGFLLDLG